MFQLHLQLTYLLRSKEARSRTLICARLWSSHSYIDKYSMKAINECIGDIGQAG